MGTGVCVAGSANQYPDPKSAICNPSVKLGCRFLPSESNVERLSGVPWVNVYD